MAPSSSCQFSLADYRPSADGVADDAGALSRLFADVQRAGGGTVLIPPGDYLVAGPGLSDGRCAAAISSHTTVFAYGARFHLPERLGDRARLVVFAGDDVERFNWFGGHFTGHCFDHRRPENTWEPNANTRIFAIGTSRGGTTRDITFRDVTGERVAGAVINVEGTGVAGSASEVDTFARNARVHDCTFTDCGKFMWDYGLLWQIIVWPEEYDHADQEMARRYFHNHLIREGVRMTDGDDRVLFDNSRDAISVSGSAAPSQALCFIGAALPVNIVRGRQYYVVDATPGYLRVSETFGGPAVRFDGSSGTDAGLVHNLQDAFYALFAPAGAGPGKGCIDLVCCRETNLTGNIISALGDTMHIQRCHGNVFGNNQIVGSRMGAFFLAEYCRNSSIVGNTVDGTNGSRVMSVEKSARDTTIIGNTFRGGGRGSWINQPQGIIFQGNIFTNNTTKGERDPWRGRRGFETGDYDRWAELYFTVHEPEGAYGPVIIRDNIFATGPECTGAISFATGGHDIQIEGNAFVGSVNSIRVAEGCARVRIGHNQGLDSGNG